MSVFSGSDALDQLNQAAESSETGSTNRTRVTTYMHMSPSYAKHNASGSRRNAVYGAAGAGRAGEACAKVTR